MTTVSTVDGQAILNKYIASQTATNTKTTTTKSDSSAAGLAGSYDTFLQILTAQLKNQDPTEPMDASKFTEQLVQYSQVEQQINTNTKLDKVITAMNSNGITPLMSYVGAYVEAPTTGDMVVQGGQSILAYKLPEEALSSTIYVKDSKGDLVATLNGSTASGLNRLVWNGTKSDGTTASDGKYTFTITAKDKSGETMKIEDMRMIACVTGIETNSSGTAVLKAGDLEIKDTDVDAVFANVGTSSSSKTST